MNWFGEKVAHFLSAIGLLLTTFMLFLVYAQLQQANEHQMWNNYNQLNIHYSRLYRDIPKDFEAKSCKRFDELNVEGKNWIRSYFNLYSEEYFLFQKKLIPEEMWTKRIENGVEVNMLSYPVIVEGYEKWKERGAFNHPGNFVEFVDAKIANLKTRLKGTLAKCNFSVTPHEANQPTSSLTLRRG